MGLGPTALGLLDPRSNQLIYTDSISKMLHSSKTIYLYSYILNITLSMQHSHITRNTFSTSSEYDHHCCWVKYSQLLNLWWQKKLLIILKYKYIHPILLHNPSSMDSIIQTRYQKILPVPSNIDQSKKIDKNPRLRYFNPIIQDCFLIGGNRNS